jgi:hypothetical protein
MPSVPFSPPPPPTYSTLEVFGATGRLPASLPGMFSKVGDGQYQLVPQRPGPSISPAMISPGALPWKRWG